MSVPAPDPGVSVLRLKGAADALRLRAQIADATAEGAPLIVDLSDATSLDPATAALLVDGIARCEATERACILLVPETCPPTVSALFERWGLAGLLPIARSWDDALRRAAPVAPQADAPGWTSPLS